MPRKSSTGRNANGNGSIRKITTTQNGKKYTYWQAHYTEGYDLGTGRQIQRSITGKMQKEVAQKLKQATLDIDNGTYTAPCKLTVGKWLNIWKEEYTGDVKESTAYVYKKNVDMYIIPHIGSVKLQTLTAPMIQSLYNKLLKPTVEDIKPLFAKSVRNVHGVLHKALQQAVLIGYIRVNPSDACKPPKAVKKDIFPLDEEQVEDFLKTIQGHPHEYLYKIALFTGLREGEILGLTWECMDLKRGTLLVKQQLRREQQKGGKYYFSPPKNNKSRVLSLAPSVIRLFHLQKLKQNGMRLEAGTLWEDQNLVFSNQTGGFLSYRTVYDCFKRVMDKIGSSSTRFHDLRIPMRLWRSKAETTLKLCRKT